MYKQARLRELSTPTELNSQSQVNLEAFFFLEGQWRHGIRIEILKMLLR